MAEGRGIKDIHPAVFYLVPSRLANKRLVKDALPNYQWIADMRRVLSVKSY
jgi:hypothetical protein